MPRTVTRIVSNSAKRNGKPFRINAVADNFYGILHLLSVGIRTCGCARMLRWRRCLFVFSRLLDGVGLVG